MTEDAYDIFDGNSSSDDEMLQKKLLQGKMQMSKSYKKIQLTKLRNLPTIIFFTFLALFSLVSLKYVIAFYKINKFTIYKNKSSIDYYSKFFSEENDFVKVISVFAQLTLVTLLFLLSALIHQRVSVPELKSERWKNALVNVASLVSILSFIGFSFYYEETLEFSKKRLNLVDNVLFPVYMLMSFVYCLMLYVVLNKMSCKEVKKDENYLNAKKYLLIVMTIQLFLYINSLIIVSFYDPKLSIEKTLFALLVSSMGINSMVFMFCHAFFIFTLKYDLFFVNITLEILPDVEYFVDFEENAKLMI